MFEGYHGRIFSTCRLLRHLVEVFDILSFSSSKFMVIFCSFCSFLVLFWTGFGKLGPFFYTRFGTYFIIFN